MMFLQQGNSVDSKTISIGAGVIATTFGITALYLGCSVNWNTIWTAVGAVATAVAVLALFLAARQLRFEAWLKAQEIFVEAEFVKARGRVLRHFSSESAWDLTDQESGLVVCRRMDEFCRLAPFFAFTESKGRNEVLKVWDNPLGRCWKLLAPLVDEERKKVEWDAKWNAFASLGEDAFRHLSRGLSKEQQTKLADIARRLEPTIREVFKRSGGAVAPVAERDCPDCAERILGRAKVCKHCGSEVVPTE